MKVRISRGSGFRGLLNYVMDDGRGARAGKRPELIDTNQPGTASGDLAGAFGVYCRLRPDIRKPVWHASLRLPAGERLSTQVWTDVATKFMHKLGFSELTPYVVVRHNDHDAGDHVHIVLSRVNLRGQVWLGQRDVQRAIAVTQQLEQEFGLTRTRGLRQRSDQPGSAEVEHVERRADSQAVVNANRVVGQPRVDATETTRILLECASESFDLASFTSKAASFGIGVAPSRKSSSGEISGLAIIPKGRKRHLALSRVTKSQLSWAKLQKSWRQQAEAALASFRSPDSQVERAEALKGAASSDCTPAMHEDQTARGEFREAGDDLLDEEAFERPRNRG